MIVEKVKSGTKEFAVDVLKGLTSDPKTLPSKYFYDTHGDALFQKIMDLEEYYLTLSEYSIFQTHKDKLLQIFNDNHGFDLIELGSGDGYKTKILLQHFIQKQGNFTYFPVDISSNVMEEYVFSLKNAYKNLDVTGICGDYFEGLEQIKEIGTRKKVLLFLGANIGNFNESETTTFLKRLNDSLSSGDILLIGFDLKKDPKVILNAYNDRSGVTRSFNLNLLKRINRELEADFNLKNFDHYPTYCPVTGEAKSFLISKAEQTVTIRKLNLSIEFKAWEPIQTEISKKYDLDSIYSLAKGTGFRVVQNLFDSNRYFVDTVWEKL